MLQEVESNENILNKYIWEKVENDCKLNLYDIFKIGEFKFYVSNLSMDSLQINNLMYKNYSNFSRLKINHKLINEENVIDSCQEENSCRICFNSYSTSENFLIAICKCIGSVKYSHLECLQTWIYSRLDFEEFENAIIIKAQMFCEICKSPFPSKNY